MTEASELSSVVQEIGAERKRQIEAEGWTAEHDDKYQRNELARAAACYVKPRLSRGSKFPPPQWPWAREWWKPGPNRRRQLIKACALIVAEIERLDRTSHG